MTGSQDVFVQIQHSEPPVVKVSGEINYRSAGDLRKALGELVDAGILEVCLDCGNVDFVDSSGIGVIVGAAGKLRSAGGNLRLIKKTRQLEHALLVSGFAPLVGVDGLVAEDISKPAPMDSSWQTLDFSLPAGMDVDGTIRRRVTEMAETMPFSTENMDDIKLAVGEAASNAFRHGIFNSMYDKVNVVCIGNSQGLTVEISNPGNEFDPGVMGAPDIAQMPEGGMGIYFMRAAMDSVDFEFESGKVMVRMKKDLRPQGE